MTIKTNFSARLSLSRHNNLPKSANIMMDTSLNSCSVQFACFVSVFFFVSCHFSAAFTQTDEQTTFIVLSCTEEGHFIRISDSFCLYSWSIFNLDSVCLEA